MARHLRKCGDDDEIESFTDSINRISWRSEEPFIAMNYDDDDERDQRQITRDVDFRGGGRLSSHKVGRDG